MNTLVNHSHQKDEETVRDPLETPLNIYGIMTSYFEENVPDWDSPCMLIADIPTAQVFEESAVLLAKSVVGDQIAVQSSAGYWHHGIYLGLQKKDSVESVWIVDVWNQKKETKETSTISVRKYKDFIRDGVAFAIIDYGNEAKCNNRARKKKDSAKLAIATMIEANKRGFEYNAVFNNCDASHFATACRTYRWDAFTLHKDVTFALHFEEGVNRSVSANTTHANKLSSDPTLTHIARILNSIHPS